MSIFKYTLPALLMLAVSCGKESPQPGKTADDLSVFFCVGGTSKASLDDNGISVNWDKSDQIGLWARNSGGEYTLDGQKFKMYGFSEGKAVFTSTLQSAMAAGEYDYFACYPYPASLNGTQAVFNLASTQDGVAGGGADIMVSETSHYGPLTKDYDERTGLSLRMKHLVHVLNFYLTEESGGLNGESVEKIELTFPSQVAGKVSVSLDNPSQATLSSGVSTITLEPSTPLAISSSVRTFASAAIFPSTFSSEDLLQVKMYSRNWTAYAEPVSLDGREFKAGHCTAVALRPGEIKPFCNINIKVAANNLGENPTKITLAAPSGCKWGDGGSNTKIIQNNSGIAVGSQFVVSYENAADFRSLSAKSVTVTYESASAVCSRTITMPNLSSVNIANVNLTVPYLFEENFASVPSFSSDDTYTSTFSTGSKDAYSFLNGWTAARAGASKGKCIRIAGRRESGLFIDSHYPARADSAPIAKLKTKANLELIFDWGVNAEGRDYYGHNIYIGYTTATTAYKSSDETGVFESGNTINVKANETDWTTNHKNASFILSNVPAGTTNRICWRCDPVGSSDFASNTTCWFYIDNVKVKIKK